MATKKKTNKNNMGAKQKTIVTKHSKLSKSGREINAPTNTIHAIATKESLIADIKRRQEDKIIEESNAKLLIKLINNADDLNEAINIAALGTTYKRTGFHFDKRLEKLGDTIKYFKKNEKLSFVGANNNKENKKSKKIDVNQKNVVHKLIIGDNYDALQNLLIEYKGKIDVIYIDPPYGKDSMGEFAETNYDNAITRDNLLSMLYNRLILARELMSDEGVIFCSIDDRNQAYVKGLFDEVFGDKNFIVTFIRKSSYGEKTAKPKINKHHEYCICYGKDINCIIENDIIVGKIKDLDEYDNPDNDPNGDWKKDSLLIKIDSGRYGYARYGIKNPYLKITDYPPVYYDENNRKQWHYVEETFNKMIKSGQVVFYKTKKEMGNSKYSFYIKKYKNSITDNTLNVSSLQFDSNEYCNSDGTTVLSSILNDKNLMGMYPKSMIFMKDLLRIINKTNVVILDFFAGSGTTGQAVLELNNEDGGNRQFILCQMNEKTDTTPNGIAYDVTCKRLKRVMTGKCYDNKSNFEWIKKNEALGGSLDVYEIAEVFDKEKTKGKTAFDVIDETLYGVEKFKNINDKIRWVCDNFEHTEKYLED